MLNPGTVLVLFVSCHNLVSPYLISGTGHTYKIYSYNYLILLIIYIILIVVIVLYQVPVILKRINHPTRQNIDYRHSYYTFYYIITEHV